MNRIIVALLISVAIPDAWAAQATQSDSLAALLTHEYQEITAEGVTRNSRYQERFYRQGDHVWIERVFPKDQPANAHKLSSHHHGADLATASRHITRTSNGKAKIALVSFTDKALINVGPEEYQTVGFNGSWSSAYHIVSPQSLKTMQRSRAPNPGSGATWYEKDSGKEIIRVLWSSDLALPLVIENRDKHGGAYSKMSVKLLPPPDKQSMPWTRIKQLTQMEFADMGD